MSIFPPCPSALSSLAKDTFSPHWWRKGHQEVHPSAPQSLIIKSNTRHKTKDLTAGKGAFGKETEESIAEPALPLKFQRQVRMCRVRTGFLVCNRTHRSPLGAGKMKFLPWQIAHRVSMCRQSSFRLWHILKGFCFLILGINRYENKLSELRSRGLNWELGTLHASTFRLTRSRSRG